MLQYLVLIGAGVQLIGIAAYIKDMVRGGAKPNRVSWLMWTIAPMIATAAALTKGVTWAVLPVFMSGFGPLIVLVASFFSKDAYWKLETFDYLCGACSLLALILWAITQEPLVAIAFAILSDGFAAVPTILKAWKYPETESAAPYASGVFSAVTAFLAIQEWSVAEYAFPAYLVLVNVTIIFSIVRPRVLKK